MVQNRPTPPGIGGEVAVTIESIAFGGDGVARHGDYVIFVPDVIPGENVKIRLTAAKRSYGKGVLIDLVEPSAERIAPRCEVYGECGGCQYQHVAYECSLRFKEQQVREVMQRIAGITIDEVCEPIQPASMPWNYRNVVSLKVRSGEGGWDAGYIARDNRTLVPVSACPIATGAVNEAMGGIGSSLGEFEHSDKITEVTIRHAGEMVLLYPRYRKPYRFKSDERLVYTYGGLTFGYGLRSFFQVNHSMIPVLLEVVDRALEPEPGGALLDLYAGVGLFSIAQAGKFDRVVGIEVAGEAVRCFRENVRQNGIQNVRIVRGAVEGVLRSAWTRLGKRSVSVLVDPPREGMHPGVVRFLNSAPIEKMVYVSCDPSTMARDLKMLSASYSLVKMVPVDMFPQTAHLETVAVLKRSDG